MRRKTPQDYLNLAQERVLEWLGPVVENTKELTSWQCARGHEFKMGYNSINSSGYGCPYCSGRTARIPADYQSLARQRGFEWLGPEVPTTKTKTRWLCPEGHTFDMNFNELHRGRGCMKCGKKAMADKSRTKPEAYHELAAKRGYEWLGPEVSTTMIRTGWRCPCGNEWSTTYQTLASKRQRSCPKCSKQTSADKRRNQPNDYHALATEFNLIWLGPEVQGNKDKTNWRCSQGHDFARTYNAVEKQRGCSICGLERLRQFSKNRAKQPNDYHALAARRGLVWLGPEVPDSNSKTNWRASCGHEWASTYGVIQSGAGLCPHCKPNAAKTAGDYADLAREREFIWIGPYPKNTTTKTTWQCLQGHVFQAKYASVRLYGCPLCDNRLNGNYISSQQVAIHAMLGGEMNRRVWRYSIDIALEVSGVNIAIEYDSAYWHEGREGEDKRRDDYLIAHDYRVLHIRSGHLLPTRAQLNAAIQELLNGATYAEIILDDWS